MTEPVLTEVELLVYEAERMLEAPVVVSPESWLLQVRWLARAAPLALAALRDALAAAEQALTDQAERIAAELERVRDSADHYELCSLTHAADIVRNFAAGGASTTREGQSDA